jgi:hypothetical protein
LSAVLSGKKSGVALTLQMLEPQREQKECATRCSEKE